MALVKDQRPRDHSQDDGAFAHGQHLSARGMYEFMEHDKSSGNINIISRSSSLSSPSSTNSSGALNIYSAMNSQQQEGQSLISFNPGHSSDNYFVHADNGSFFSFEQDDFSSVLDQNQVNQWRSISKVHVLENFNAIQNASGSSTLKANLNHGDHESYSWLNSEATLSVDCIEQELTTEQPGCHKRTHTGESSQALKKQCTSASKKPKPKSLSTTQSISKDPQSIAAKNRRERISERLKILQDLVPNGSKVDLVTMLEKAISYVKFLQLQMKVLASDELWPVQGGKAPELSQVKDAIDAIIASQIDTNST